MIRKLLCMACLLCCLLVLPMCCSAASYSITEAELTQLQDNLTLLENLNNQQLTALSQSKTDCQTLKDQLTESNKQIATLKTQLITLQNQSTQAMTALQQAQEQLNNAKKSYQQLENAEHRKIRLLTVERNLLASLAIWLAAK